MRVAFPALGTTAVLVVTDPARVAPARAVLDEELRLVDAACSRFRADSELSAVNAAGGDSVAVSSYFFRALRVAVEAARTTGGLVDPTVGRPLRLAGYDRTLRLVLARDGASFRPRFERAPGWQVVELDERRQRVRVPAGVELDLGATAKALAADRAARAAARAAGCGVLVALGGDVAVAGRAPGGGWTIGVADDHATAPESATTAVAISAGGLATSSVTERRWRAGDAELHHVLDPRTGRPAATRWLTVTVAAASCVDANVAATAALLLDGDAPAWLAARRLPARLVSADGDVAGIAEWPQAA